MGGGDESQGLDALITIVPPPEVCVETVNWHLRGAEKFNPKRVAVLYDITQDALRAEAELIRDLAPKIGYELVAFEAFRVNDADFRAQLTTIKGTTPEWLGVYAANPEGSKIVNQMDELELL